MATTVFTFAKRSISTGVFNLPIRAVPAQINTLSFRIARNTPSDVTIWADQNTVVSIELDISQDGGNTFQFGGALSAPGGQIIDRHTGAAQPYAIFTFPIDSSVTHVTGAVTVTKGPLVTSGDIIANI